jgi:hypothetical protein
MRGIRRVTKMAPNGKAPLLPVQLRQAIDVLPDTLLGKRDHAVLVIGIAGAFCRSELVALMMKDIQATREGLIVTLRRSKTDQEGQTMVRGLPRGASETSCPVRVLEQWVTAAKITSGPIFRPVNRVAGAERQWLVQDVPAALPPAFDQWVSHIQYGTRAIENITIGVDLTAIIEAATRSATIGALSSYPTPVAVLIAVLPRSAGGFHAALDARPVLMRLPTSTACASDQPCWRAAPHQQSCALGCSTIVSSLGTPAKPAGVRRTQTVLLTEADAREVAS